MNIIEIQQLNKWYDSLHAVNDISFNIPQGSCVGLLGPNGAGKTTTIEIIEGIIKPTSGQILFKGKPIDQDFKKLAGIQFQQTALPDYLTTFETLKLFASFYSSHMELETLIELCDLAEFRDTYATRLSGGQRQRLLLALALINDPDIVFLDEPTTGLDPQSRRKFWHLIDTIKQQGKTILLTTHYMEEAEFLSDHLIIMDHGSIISEGSPQQLLAEHFDNSYISLNRSEQLTKDLFNSESLAASHINWLEDKCLIYSSDIQKSLSALLKLDISLDNMRIHQPTLEDLFLKLTGHSLRE